MMQFTALAIHIFVPLVWGVGIFFLFQLIYRRRARRQAAGRSCSGFPSGRRFP